MPQANILKMIIAGLTEQTGVVDLYLKEVSLLEKKDIDLKICDLDDTLFSRQEQLESEELLKNNRWVSGNTQIFNILGLDNYIQKYYSWVSFPQKIFSTLNQDCDLILTAGMKELQYAKAQATWIDTFNITVVPDAQDKVLETIRYVIFELKYIPSSITIYEDRPQYFIEYRELLQDILGTKVHIMYVEMDGNNGYKKISRI